MAVISGGQAPDQRLRFRQQDLLRKNPERVRDEAEQPRGISQGACVLACVHVCVRRWKWR